MSKIITILIICLFASTAFANPDESSKESSETLIKLIDEIDFSKLSENLNDLHTLVYEEHYLNLKKDSNYQEEDKIIKKEIPSKFLIYFKQDCSEQFNQEIINSISAQYNNSLNVFDLFSLRIDNYKYDLLPCDINKFQNLKYLNINKGNIKKISEKMFSLKNLYEIDLSDNKLLLVNENFSPLDKLEKLNLSNNIIKEVPDNILKLNELFYLNLENNYIKTLPNTFPNTSKLALIYLSKNKIEGLPPTFYNLKHLDTLDLSYNKIKKLDPAINSLKTLNTLNLSNNFISVIPKDFYQLNNLRHLDLGKNEFESFPGHLLLLNKLKILSLYGNYINDLCTLEKVDLKRSRLENLIVTDNNINGISEFTNIKSLRELSAEKNKVQKLDNINLESDLERIYLDLNNITDFSPLLKLKKIKTISLIGNNISTIPASINDVNHKIKLYLSYNPIPEKEFSKIKNKNVVIRFVKEKWE